MVSKKDKFLAAAGKLLERGAVDKALVEFKNAAQEDPKDTRIWLKIAEIHVRRGARQEALEVYLKTADLYTEQGFFQRAVAVYKNILKLSPGYVQAHFKLADLFKQLGLLSDAMQQFELAAQTQQKAGRPQEALAAMRQIVELNPDHAVARIKLAEAASLAGATDEAVREFKRAAEQLKAQGKTEEYMRVGERLLAHDANNFALAKELAGLYIERGNGRFALSKLQPCFAADARDTDTLSLLARAFEQVGQNIKTLSVLRELLRVQEDLGRVADVRETCRRILAVAPDDPDARERLARAEAAKPIVTPVPPRRPVVIEDDGPSPAITFSEMAIPQFLLPKDTQSSPAVPAVPSATSTAERVAFAAANLGRTQEEVLAEMQRITSECEVFIKYGLLERAVEHLRKIFELDQRHAATRERLVGVLLDLGRGAEAARELQVLAEDVRADDPVRAAEYQRRALEADPAPAPRDFEPPGTDPAADVRAAAPSSGAGAFALDPSSGGGFALPSSTGGAFALPNVTGDSLGFALPPGSSGASGFLAPAPSGDLGALPEPSEKTDGDDISGELIDFDALEPEELVDEVADVLAAPVPASITQEATGALPHPRAPQEPSGSIDIDLDPAAFAARAAEPPPSEHDAITREVPDPTGFERAPRTVQESFSVAALNADLEQVDFFLQQGLADEAQSLLEDLQTRYPGQESVSERLAKVLALAEHGATPTTPHASARESAPPSSPVAAPRAVVSSGGTADPSTHGDLGIAYKEMGLFDAAIKEFRLLSQDANREVFALTMMGECYEAKGSLADAVIQYKKALNRPSVKDDEATQLYFLLGKVFEALGDRKEALYFFEKVARRDPAFGDVSDRLARLRAGDDGARRADGGGRSRS